MGFIVFPPPTIQVQFSEDECLSVVAVDIVL